MVGGIFGTIVVAATSKKKVCSCLTNNYEKITDVLKFVNENRREIIEKLKTTSDKITNAIDDANKDLKAISENIKHLKDSSSHMVVTVKETKEQLVTMYEECKQKYETTGIQQLEEKKDA